MQSFLLSNTHDFWQDIDTVLLDMDGTLLDLHFDNYFWQTVLPEQYSLKYSKHQKMSFEDLEDMFHKKRGTLNWYCVDFWTEKLNMDVMSLKREHSHLIQYRPATPEFLDFLLNKNITPVLVTNAHRKSLDLKLARCPLGNWIPDLFSSHDFGLPKEDVNFWPTFMKAYAFDKERTLFIDDNDSVLKNAQAFGIKHLLSIEFPDSSRKESHTSEFPLINHFNDLIV
jgi:putative hydrolase of the HAD superfamily